MNKPLQNTCHRLGRAGRLCRFAAGLAAAGFGFGPALVADTLYWNGGDGTWMAGTGTAGWSDTAESGAGSLGWIDNNDAVFTSANPTLTIGSAASDKVYVGNLTIQNGLTLKQAANAVDFYITGAGSGNLTLQATAIQLRTFLQSSSAWNGTISVSGSASNSNYVYVDSASAVGSSTRLNVDLGYVLFGASSGSASFTIGELSGADSNSLIRSRGDSVQTLRIEQNTDTTYAGRIGSATTGTWNLNLIKAGTGTLVLSGDVSHAGTTLVESGKLYFNGTTSARNTLNGVSVASGATLGGKGLIGIGGGATRNVTIADGGILAPGGVDEIGTLTINGNSTAGALVTSAGLVFTKNATIQVRLAELGTNDKIVLTGNGTNFGKGSAAGGDGSILFDFTNDNGLAELGTYDLITFANEPGIVLSTFGLTQASIDAGWAGTFGYSGNILQFTVTGIGTVIPESSTYAAIIGGLALAGVICVRRRRT
ncbi:autotransporter [Opitutaceae bacterium TAV5]|nr:autotransporter [Opitutaceae bacterium TAV5]